MSKFLDIPATCRAIGVRNGSAIFQLVGEFRFRSAHGEVVVPDGFVTDGASIPRPFWNIMGPFGSYFESAIIHDYLYSHHNRTHNRATCDAIFLEAMEEQKVGWLTRKTIYRAVRMFGWRFYQGKK